MKKIKNASQLKEEKMRLRIAELELEKTLKRDWAEVKEKLSPKSLLVDSVQHLKNKHWLENAINSAVSFLGSRMLQKLDEKIETGESEENFRNHFDLARKKHGADKFHQETY
jgi:hypothetical protein